MKKLLLFLLLLINSDLSFGQNWNCFLPNAKQFFTNSNGYLRGMRIDSVKTIGTDTVYYPFHTPRASDTNGGSWLGKSVIKKIDGTFLFDGLGGDTVVIKTQANPGDSWMFYDDTTPFYYLADVTSFDTASIQGVLDSIKRISITAYAGTSFANGDSINNLKIILSKNHGFVNVFDLYTFPYYWAFGDYYFEMVQYPASMAPQSSWPYAINRYQEFTQVVYHYPTSSEIYDYNISDVFEDNKYHYQEKPNYQNQSTQVDSIIAKTILSDTIIYTAQYFGGTITYQYRDSILFDTTKMPEEWNAHYNYYFWPNDSSNCYISSTYEVDYEGDGLPWIPFENCGMSIQKYKTGVGRIVSHNVSGQPYFVYSQMPGCIIFDETWRVCKKNGVVCNNCHVSDVSNLKNSISSLQIYPNPVNDELNIQMLGSTYARVCLVNMLGQIVFSTETGKEKISVPTSKLAGGVYIIKIADENGGVMSKKVIIEH